MSHDRLMMSLRNLQAVAIQMEHTKFFSPHGEPDFDADLDDWLDHMELLSPEQVERHLVEIEKRSPHSSVGLEHPPPKRRVAGSSPAEGTTWMSKVAMVALTFVAAFIQQAAFHAMLGWRGQR